MTGGETIVALPGAVPETVGKGASLISISMAFCWSEGEAIATGTVITAAPVVLVGLSAVPPAVLLALDALRSSFFS